MKQETKRRVENLMFALQLTLESLDDLKQDKFYSKDIKFHGNRLLEKIEKTFAEAFKDSSEKGTNYYIRLNDWLKIASYTFSKFENMSENDKVRYLAGLSNFNTINLR